MKEATGELSMTAIVVVILGAFALAAPAVIKYFTTAAAGKMACQVAYSCECTGYSEGDTVSCKYSKEDETTGNLIEANTTCDYKDVCK